MEYALDSDHRVILAYGLWLSLDCARVVGAIKHLYCIPHSGIAGTNGLARNLRIAPLCLGVHSLLPVQPECPPGVFRRDVRLVLRQCGFRDPPALAWLYLPGSRASCDRVSGPPPEMALVAAFAVCCVG